MNELNDTAMMATVPTVFDAQAERAPESIAVVCGDYQVTYGALNERANRVAHRLWNLGVGPEVVVGLCVERSVEMVVGLLGILKAGGAYLPIDPEHPQARIRHIVADAKAKAILGTLAFLDEL